MSKVELFHAAENHPVYTAAIRLAMSGFEAHSSTLSTLQRGVSELILLKNDIIPKIGGRLRKCACICCWQLSPAQAFETISFTEKMRSSETLAAVVSMGPGHPRNAVISSISLFVGDVHFPRRPYDGQFECN